MPVYAGLVETARTADRQGLTYGAAYLREASSFLRTTLLPAAQQAYDAQAATLAEDQAVADGGMWTVLALVAVVAALVAVWRLHRRIARTTKRRLTPGVALAGAALGLLLVWGVVALGLCAALHRLGPRRRVGAATASWSRPGSRSCSRAATRCSPSSRAPAGGDYEQDYVRRSIAPVRLAGPARPRPRRGGARAGRRRRDDRRLRSGAQGIVVHELVRTLDVSGDYDQAVALALSTAPDGGQGSVQQVEDALDRAVIDDRRHRGLRRRGGRLRDDAARRRGRRAHPGGRRRARGRGVAAAAGVPVRAGAALVAARARDAARGLLAGGRAGPGRAGAPGPRRDHRDRRRPARGDRHQLRRPAGQRHPDARAAARERCPPARRWPGSPPAAR